MVYVNKFALVIKSNDLQDLREIELKLQKILEEAEQKGNIIEYSLDLYI